MMKLKTLPKFINHLPKFTNHHNTHHTNDSPKRKVTLYPAKGLRNLRISHKMVLAFGGNILVLLLLGIFILTGQTTQRVLIATGLIVLNIALAVFNGILLTRSIGGRVKQMVLSAQKLAEGDVNVEIETGEEDEIGIFLNSFSKIAENMKVQASILQRLAEGDMTVEVPVNSEKDLIGNSLSKLVEQNNQLMLNIRESANQVASGAAQVSESSQMLSSGATEQASSVDELTVTMEQIETQTVQNAEYANHANGLTLRAKDLAAAGNDKVKEMVGSMAEINESSNNISKIIKVIDDIAFQTNILALNAAVEAARAGQNGKGFAVVAEEVRNLAVKSAEAAQETTQLIEGSIKKVKSGTKLAKETADQFGQIVEGVTEVSDLVSKIATSSNEQASSITQVNGAIMQVSNVIQSNSATSEESAAASEELSSQAENLKEMIRTFKLKTHKREKVDLSELSPEALAELKEYARKKKALQKTAATDSALSTPDEKPIKLDELTISKY